MTEALPDDGQTRPEDDVEMGFFDHLRELRTRIVRALFGVIPGVVIAWGYKEQLLDLLLKPWIAAWRNLGLGDPKIHFANPMDPFIVYLKIAMVAGVLAATPWIFWQVWGFIAPGLYRKEKRMALPFVFFSTVCFVGGAAFGYLVVFPMAFETFLGFAGMLPSHDIVVQPTIMITEYMSLVTRLLLAFGIVFEVPVVVTFLAAMGVVNGPMLLRFSRWWVLVAALLSAILTPPDVASQVMMLVPLVVLYFISVGIAFIIGDRKKKRAEAENTEGYER
ncbi:MAG: twin-arginine translocase subunit TatC [Deltaproteobacteria bacterium]|nr:twin-arginine translocase subunit TatC [Deltaproteobacteria bacterium]